MNQAFLYKNAQDFAQKYKNTYGVLTADGKRTLVYIERVTVDAEPPFVRVLDKNSVDYQVNIAQESNGVEFSFIPTGSGWVETELGCIYMNRTAARQYKAGVSNDNTSFMDLDGRWKDCSFPYVAAVFDPVKSPKVDGIVLSPYFAFSLTSGRLWARNTTMGSAKLSGKEISVIIEDPIWNLYCQELGDMATRKGYTIKRG